MKKFFALIALALAALAGLSASAGGGSLLWKVTGNGLAKPTYILGSHHVAPPAMADSIKGLREAVRGADAIYGEVDQASLTGPELQQKSLAYMLAPADSTLSRVLGPERLATVDSVLAVLTGMPGLAAQMEMLKPAAVSAQLAVWMSGKAFPERDPMRPFDLVVMTLPEAEGKPQGGFETVEQQLEMLMGDSLARQADDLYAACAGIDLQLDGARRLAAAYEAQDLDALTAIMNEPGLGLDVASLERLITRRNRAWAARLAELMPREGLFVVVGAGHLGGDDGLLGLLRGMGYTVQPVN